MSRLLIRGPRRQKNDCSLEIVFPPESLDEEAINPDGYSLGKGNYEFPQGYVPVPNNYEWSILEWKWVAP